MDQIMIQFCRFNSPRILLFQVPSTISPHLSAYYLATQPQLKSASYKLTSSPANSESQEASALTFRRRLGARRGNTKHYVTALNLEHGLL